MAKKLDTTYKSARYGSCTYALILDKRHPKKDRETFPVAMRYTIDRKSWDSFVAGEFTELSQFVVASPDDVEFVWVTDGQGWKTAHLPLSEAFGHISNVFNLEMLKQGFLFELFR